MKKNKARTNTQDVIRPWYFNKWLLRTLAVMALLSFAFVIFIWYAYRAAQVVPEYYQVILKQPAAELDQAGDEFETELLELQNNAIKMGQWQAVFTQNQINGWLSSDLPQKFPDSLPDSITNPRISLEDDEFRIIFRYESKRLTGIVEASGDLFCTPEMNRIALRVNHIRSGVLSLPVSSWTEQIGKILWRNGYETYWTEESGDTIALIQIPRKISDKKGQKLIVESIEVLDQKLILQGVTIDPDDLQAYERSKKDAQSN